MQRRLRVYSDPDLLQAAISLTIVKVSGTRSPYTTVGYLRDLAKRLAIQILLDMTFV